MPFVLKLALLLTIFFVGSKASGPTFVVAQQQSPYVLWIDLYVGVIDANGKVADNFTYMYQTGNDVEVGDWFLGTADPSTGEYYITGGDDANPPYPIWRYSPDGQTTQIFASYPTIQDFHAINSTCVLVVRSNFSDNQVYYLIEAFNPQTSEIKLIRQLPQTAVLFDTQGVTYFDVLSGNLFGVSYYQSLNNGFLSIWNIETGKYSKVAITGPYLIGIAYSSKTKTIYGLASSNYFGTETWIVTINPTTGDTSNVTTSIAYSAIEWSPLLIDTTTETLYYLTATIQPNGNYITTVDATTRTVSQIPLSGPSEMVEGVFGLQFQPLF